MSKSYDAATAESKRNMKVIKTSFYANDMDGRVVSPPAVHSSLLPPVQVPAAYLGVPDPEFIGSSEEPFDDAAGFDEELCSLHDESVHDDDCDDEVASALSGSGFLPVGPSQPVSSAFLPAGIDLWVAEAANQKLMVPPGKQPLDGLLSESEHYPSKNPDEIHPDMIGTILVSYGSHPFDVTCACRSDCSIGLLAQVIIYGTE
jgi:hypothetical protein